MTKKNEKEENVVMMSNGYKIVLCQMNYQDKYK